MVFICTVSFTCLPACILVFFRNGSLVVTIACTHWAEVCLHAFDFLRAGDLPGGYQRAACQSRLSTSTLHLRIFAPKLTLESRWRTLWDILRWHPSPKWRVEGCPTAPAAHPNSLIHLASWERKIGVNPYCRGLATYPYDGSKFLIWPRFQIPEADLNMILPMVEASTLAVGTLLLSAALGPHSSRRNAPLS